MPAHHSALPSGTTPAQPQVPGDGDACYRAMCAHDARFDGLFFTGVTSTGIYCRPICRVRTPMRGNCVFFALAAQAEQAGFRPCLRCRPELAPQARPWSTHDASQVLLSQAVRLLQQTDAAWSGTSGPTVAALAQRLGVSDRHVRRIFMAGLGVSPLQYLQTQRLLTAKQLLTDTQLPVTEVAHLSGFGSVRRFNDALKTHYALTPGAMRRAALPHTPAAHTRLTLAYRPPYAMEHLLGYLAQRAVPGVESVDVAQRTITRTWQAATDVGADKGPSGWLRVAFDATRPVVHLDVSEELTRALPAVVQRVRQWLDLDAEPQAMAQTLQADFPEALGVRLPGCLDGFELAVRAVLGQQITVHAANVLMARLTQALGSPVQTPWPAINRLVPTPAQVLQTPDDTLGALGLIGQKQRAIKALAHAVLNTGLALNPTANPHTTEAALQALPGIGPWTSSYVLMRALHWPNAFPAQDVVLQKAMGTRTLPRPHLATEQQANAWQPWRSYAAMCLWLGLQPAQT